MILLLSDIKNSSNSKSLNQVKWVRDNLDGYLNFYSVSGDGRSINKLSFKINIAIANIINMANA